ncbi:ABC-three component system protein [Xanthomonas cannabis]|uniref:ABC-three component system protein n=1 Tax=Xanthomonas cannabis TaxID=1885674 RepID=UPI00141AFFE1|nr:ABC-three component system protein [Xanthomonas cannabis]NIK65450.1 hypothetical protein [Xanthomonas cannabis]
MTPQEIVEAALVTGTKRIFVLGCFEQRVTVYSQQVRALNLVDALLSQNMVRRNGGKVAIVGGGVAGMTAAVAFAKAAPELARLDLFERRSSTLDFQRNSRRFLHPHFYDWPAPGSDQSDAGLPIMNWQAGPAGDVAKKLAAEFDSATGTSMLTVFCDDEVTELKSSDRGPVRVVTKAGTAANRIYDLVVLAIGFGVERFTGPETRSYWTPTELSGPILENIETPLIFISGNGDGGLVDFLIAAFDSHEHSEICQLLIDQDLGPALAELEAIEREAWAPDADIDLLAHYRARVRHLVPSDVWAAISERLRPNVQIYLHTKEQRLLRRATALHNRFTAFLVLEADADDAIGRKAITLKVGIDFDGVPPKSGDVRLVGDTDAIQPFKRFLRLGPDAEDNLTPFAKLLADYRVSIAAGNPVRPVSPRLTPTAVDRFEPFRANAAIASVQVAPLIATHPHAQRVTIAVAASGNVIWAGDIQPSNVHLFWAAGSRVDLYCDVNAADASRLLTVIARIGAHASGLTLIVRDAARWRAALNGLWSDHSHPGPQMAFSSPIEDWRDPPAIDQLVELRLGEMIDTMQERLDISTLSTVHDALFDILGPPAVPTGWVIEPALRDQLWELWQIWNDALAIDPEKRRRFLRLLASVHDKADAEEAALVRIGPKIVSRYLTMPTIFALAFAACSGRPVAPASQHPGNISVAALTGHTCGVEWIDRRSIHALMAGQHSWTTSVVLLSELSESVQMMEGDIRMDQSSSDRPKLGVPSLSERPIVIGANGEFLRALEEGSLAVQRFFQSIFQRRADAAQQSLEEVEDA